MRRQGGLGVLLNASLLAPDLLPSGDIDAASLVNSRPEKPRVDPVPEVLEDEDEGDEVEPLLMFLAYFVGVA